MKKFNLDFVLDPSFNSVTKLTNITFNPTNYVENRMATEQQISELYNRIVENEIRRDYCCRDIIVWEAHTQIVRMNTFNLDGSNILRGGGAVISDFNENISIGTMRRGLSYTVTFPIKWDSNLFTARNVGVTTGTNCLSAGPSTDFTLVSYRIIEENSIAVGDCQSTSLNYARFWYSINTQISDNLNNDVNGHRINPNNNWGSFVHDIKDDGTVTITDHRRNTNFNVIRFYTQWILRRTADNQTIPDPT